MNVFALKIRDASFFLFTIIGTLSTCFGCSNCQSKHSVSEASTGTSKVVSNRQRLCLAIGHCLWILGNAMHYESRRKRTSFQRDYVRHHGLQSSSLHCCGKDMLRPSRPCHLSSRIYGMLGWSHQLLRFSSARRRPQQI